MESNRMSIHARAPLSWAHFPEMCSGKEQASFLSSPLGLVANGCQMTRSDDYIALGETRWTGGRLECDQSAGLLQEQQQRQGYLDNAKPLSECPTIRALITINKRSNALTTLFGYCGTFNMRPWWHDKVNPKSSSDWCSEQWFPPSALG